MKKLFALAALVLGLASCQTEPEGLDVVMGGEVDATICVEIPEAETRAMDSAQGIFGTETLAGDATMRYILEIYHNDECAERQVKYADGKTMAFPVRLVPGRAYDFVVWADVVTAENAGDNHYVTENGLTNITLKGEWNAMDETRDAFTGVMSVAQFSNSSNITFDLTRPFAKLRVRTTDIKDVVKLGITPTTATVVYTTDHRQSFNARTKAYGNADLDKTQEVDYRVVSYEDVTTASTYTLFADYFFADNDTVNFTLEVKDASNNIIGKKLTFNTPINVRRNYLTTISGTLLTDDNNVNVEIKPGFGGETGEEDGKTFARVDTAEEFFQALTDGKETIILDDDINLNDILSAGTLSTTRANTTITATVAAGKTLTIDLNNYTLSSTSTETGENFNMIDVRGTLTIKNGTITTKHEGNNMEWNHSTNVFNVTAGGVLNLDGVTAKNLGGSDMAFVAHLNNWGEVTLNVENSTLESTYIAVRVFNSGNDMNNVTIKNSTLKGKYCFWVHNYTLADFGNQDKVDAHKALLNFDIYNTTDQDSNNNKFEFTNTYGAPVLYGFTDAVYFNEYGDEYVANGVGMNDGNYIIYSTEGLKWVAEQVMAGNNFNKKTVLVAADIDLKNEEWTPIGNSTTAFQGTFDGQNHTISNLTITGYNSNVGLFGVTTNGEIRNLVVENAKVSGRLNVGVVAGTPYTSKYTNITVQGHVEVNGMAYVGGVGGKNAYANWTNITVDVDETSYVKANSIEDGTAYRTYVGGVCGFMGEGTHSFTDVTSNIDVKGSTCDVGGIVGIAHYGNSFIRCASSGDIEIYAAEEQEDAQQIGGIAGVWMNSSQDVIFTDCEFTGTLKATNAEGDEYDIITSLYGGNLVCAAYNASVGDNKLIINGVEYQYAVAADTADALVEALENGENVVFTDDIKIEPAGMSNAYGTTGINVTNGQTIDGNGHTLDIAGASGTWDSGISTTGGLIKNITVTGSFRGIFINHNSDNCSKVYLENVIIDGTTYTISCDQGTYNGLEATNSTFKGWTSYAATLGDAKFTDCYFGKGNGYSFCRPYAPTEFVGCEFEAGYRIDPRAEISFENCTFGGVALTAENVAELVSNTAKVTIK